MPLPIEWRACHGDPVVRVRRRSGGALPGELRIVPAAGGRGARGEPAQFAERVARQRLCDRDEAGPPERPVVRWSGRMDRLQQGQPNAERGPIRAPPSAGPPGRRDPRVTQAGPHRVRDVAGSSRRPRGGDQGRAASMCAATNALEAAVTGLAARAVARAVMAAPHRSGGSRRGSAACRWPPPSPAAISGDAPKTCHRPGQAGKP